MPLPPPALDGECGISSPGAHLKPGWLARRLATGGPHLKPQVGEHLEQRLAAPPTGPKQRTKLCVTLSQSGPAHPRDSSPKQLDRRAASKAAGLAGCPRPKHKVLDCLINGQAASQGPHQQRLPNTCTQSPAGPTSAIGQRQNTQQRGAAGLGETAFPRKTQPSRGLNYPIAAPRAPSI